MITVKNIVKYVVEDGTEFDTEEEAKLYELGPLFQNIDPTALQCFTSQGELVEWSNLNARWAFVDFVIIKTEEAFKLLEEILDESDWGYPLGIGVWRYDDTYYNTWIEYNDEMKKWNPIRDYID